jgi:putative endonuclease
MATVYILYSEKLDKYYIGSTEGSIEERFKKHLSGHKGFTAKVKDWKVIYSEILPDKHQALTREKHIKSWKSRKMFEKLINIT